MRRGDVRQRKARRQPRAQHAAAQERGDRGATLFLNDERQVAGLQHMDARAAERFGFKYEGRFRQHMIVKGENRDTAWFSIIDQEWPALRRAYEAWLAPANFDAGGGQKRRLEEFRAEFGA